MNNTNKEIEERIHELAINLEKSRIHEYMDYISNKKRLLYINFLSGIARGFGMAIGFTLLGAVVIYFLQKAITLNIPLIGDFIADLVKIVQENL